MAAREFGPVASGARLRHFFDYTKLVEKTLRDHAVPGYSASICLRIPCPTCKQWTNFLSASEQVRMVSRIDSVIGERTARRRATAFARVDPLLRDLRLDGIDIVVIGSLARREFKSHSDVDFLVRGRLDTPALAKVERAVAAAMRGSGIPYDLIYAADLTPERLKKLERDLVQASGKDCT
jgi:predicted nucleotidyltransferase